MDKNTLVRALVWFAPLALATAGCAKTSGRSGQPVDGRPPMSIPEPPPDSSVTPVDLGPGDRPRADAAPRPCQNLECQQVKCPASATTSVSGTAFAPNGTLPLYNVMAYVPNAPLEPFKAGITCDRCGVVVSGRPIASAISNHEGKFKIDNVPAGKDIPLVLQVGKWRRQVTIPEVKACQDNALGDPNLTRLPRHRKEGDMPRMLAMSGECDSLNCLLPKVGIDPIEFGEEGEDKAITFFKGLSFSPASGPVTATSVVGIWRDETELQKYDLLLLGCECFRELGNKGVRAWQAITNYLAKGGRLFGSHFMYVWYEFTPDPGLAAAVTVVTDPASYVTPVNPIVINTSFPKGKAMADWMKFLNPMQTYGQLTADELFGDLAATMPGTAQVWGSSGPNGGARIVSVNTPVGVPSDQQCGRAVHLDAHVFSTKKLPVGPITSPQFSYPQICGKDLRDGEEALAFLFFDLAACVQSDQTPVEPPPIIVP